MSAPSRNAPPVRRPSFGAAVLAAAVLCMLGVGGCFKPNIKDGGFSCSSEFVQECPDGFRCINGQCWRGAPTDGPVVEVKPDTKVDAPSDKPNVVDAPSDKGTDAACLKPVSGCTSQAGKCDPLCQTGCGCQQKCSVNTLGALTCNQPAGGLVRKENESCDPVSSGTDIQTDDCAPGLVCVDRACNTQCAKLCRVDADCPGSTCSREYAPGFKVCDVPATDCNPVKALPPTNCPAPAQGCYLSGTITDRVVCDCPFNSVGEGSPCNLSRDCLPGMACIDITGTNNLRCQIVCSLLGATTGCPGTQTCHKLNDSTKYGTCRN